MERLPTTTEAPAEMNDTEFLNGMKRTNKGKSSSQSGQHYSMYKALIAFPFTSQIIVEIISTCVDNNIIIKR